MIDSYFSRALQALNNPAQLWKVAFRSHLGPDERSLLLVLATLPAVVEAEDLRRAAKSYSDQNRDVSGLRTFESSLSTLEGGFVTIEAQGELRFVRFHNPSVVDFMVGVLQENPEEVELLLSGACFFEQLESIVAFAFGTMRRYPLKRPVPSQRIRGAIVAHCSSNPETGGRLLSSSSATWRTSRSTSGTRRVPEIASWDERLGTVLGFPAEIRPSQARVERLLIEAMDRWASGQLDKADAVKVEQISAGLGVDAGLLEQLREILRQRLMIDPETMEDWAPLLDFSVRLGLVERFALVDRFREFVSGEFQSWDPSPPDLEEIEQYAEQLGILEEIEEAVDEARERDRIADDDAAAVPEERNQKADNPEQEPAEIESPDSEIDSLFASLAGWQRIRDSNGGSSVDE